jgi:tetratricopeptide (TPR) repeat protein
VKEKQNVSDKNTNVVKMIPCPTAECKTLLKIPLDKERVKLRCPNCQNVFSYEKAYHELYVYHEHAFLNYLTQNYLIPQKTEEAIKLARKKTEIFPNDSVAFYGLGVANYAKVSNLYFEVKRAREEAVRSLQKSIELNPSFPAPHISLILVHLADGNNSAAIKTAEKFLSNRERDKSQDFEVYRLLGSAYQAQGRKKKAREFYQKALKEESRLLQVHQGLGQLFLEENKLEEAAKEFRKEIENTLTNQEIPGSALTTLPSFLLSYLRLKEVLKKQGKSSKEIAADKTIQKAKKALNLSEQEIKQKLKDLGFNP